MNTRVAMESLFRKRISDLFTSLGDGNVAVFFMGFSPWQNRIVLECDQALKIPGVSWLYDQGCLDLTVIENTAKKSILTVCNTEGLVVALYEHLVRMRGSLSDLYDGEIVVVTNNLFEIDDLYPCAISTNSISVLKEYLEQPDRDMPEAAILPSRYYADVIEVKDNFLVAPIRYKEDVGYKELGLFDDKNPSPSASSSIGTIISVPSSDFTSYRLDLAEGVAEQA